VKIHEAEARELLARAGLPVPDADVATTAAGARAIAERLFSLWKSIGLAEDGTVKIWDLRASGFQREYESRGAVNSVVLHPNQARAQTRALGRLGLLCRAAAAG
jgi:hypothetical protein